MHSAFIARGLLPGGHPGAGSPFPRGSSRAASAAPVLAQSSELIPVGRGEEERA